MPAHPLNVGPRATVHPQDASALGLVDGATGKFGAPAGTAALPVLVDDRVAPGTVWIESGYGATSPLGAGRLSVGRA